MYPPPADMVWWETTTIFKHSNNTYKMYWSLHPKYVACENVIVVGRHRADRMPVTSNLGGQILLALQHWRK